MDFLKGMVGNISGGETLAHFKAEIDGDKTEQIFMVANS